MLDSQRDCEACTYDLFKDSPARRADYTVATSSTCFSKKFCQILCVRNSDVAARAIEIFPHVKKYVENSEKAKKLPNNSTCNNITATCTNPLTLAKLSFFASVASTFEPFLRKYQTSDPMIAFLHDDAANLLRCFLQRFVKSSFLKDADTSYMLIKLVLTTKDTLMTYKVGVDAVKCLASSKTSDLVQMDFKMQCIAFMKIAAS